MRAVVLLDFTAITDSLVSSVLRLSQLNGYDLILLHITGDETGQAKLKLQTYERVFIESGLYKSVKAELRTGDFFDEVGGIISELEADLTVVGTHGKRGLKQNLFGSNILKLVKLLPSSVLVLHDNSDTGAINKVLMPTSHDSDIENKLKRTLQIVGKSVKYIFHGIKVNQSMDEVLMARMKTAREFMQANGVEYSVVLEEIKVFSPGFSKQTLAYVESNPVDMICISVETSVENAFYSNNDTENIILNHRGLPVLCIR
jgi:nucleotide-binding universal stress UspA family protein